MRKVLVIGIGPGHPEQVTIQAINAMNRVNVFFLIDKGATTAELMQIRTDILERYIGHRNYRVFEISDPPRDRSSQSYQAGVQDWHARRAELYARAIHDELADDECGAFLVWGDPSLYDSTLRILEHALRGGTVAFDYEVIPGVTSVQALAASHRIPLHGIGEPLVITTGRRLAMDWARGIDNAAVMLDGDCAFAALPAESTDIYWAAYLGMPDQITLSGRLGEVRDQICRTRATARTRKGWIMDTYLLRRHRPTVEGA